MLHSPFSSAPRERNAEHSREAILKAAVREFAQEGVAGARTDEIAHAAGVNKALLYYYFKDKETLYGAVLDFTFTGLAGARRSRSSTPTRTPARRSSATSPLTSITWRNRHSCRDWCNWR